MHHLKSLRSSLAFENDERVGRRGSASTRFARLMILLYIFKFREKHNIFWEGAELFGKA
jgi:hypothetical protein